MFGKTAILKVTKKFPPKNENNSNLPPTTLLKIDSPANVFRDYGTIYLDRYFLCIFNFSFGSMVPSICIHEF